MRLIEYLKNIKSINPTIESKAESIGFAAVIENYESDMSSQDMLFLVFNKALKIEIKFKNPESTFKASGE